jgi:hypothetical protein
MAGTISEVQHYDVLGQDSAYESSIHGGCYEGQKVDLYPESKSMLALAYEMDDCPKDVNINRSKLTKRDIKDRKKAAAKKRIIASYISRVDLGNGMQRYSDYENKMNRLKRQVMMQNQHTMREGGDGDLTYDGEDLADYMLRTISSDFNEVTDQHNVLEYLQELETFLSESDGEEIAQCEKMLLRLHGKTDQKSLERIGDLTTKIKALNEQILLSDLFRRAFAKNKENLERSHGQEIKDGYNIFPKSMGLIKHPIIVGGRKIGSVEFAIIYRDKILCCNNFFEAFEALVFICMYPDSDDFGQSSQ